MFIPIIIENKYSKKLLKWRDTKEILNMHAYI